MRRFGFRSKFTAGVIAIAVVSIPASLLLFRPALPGGFALPVAVLPFVLGLKILEGLALGTGLGFLFFGYPLLRRARQSRMLTVLAYLSIAWYLVNWWPHDNLHLINGSNLWGLLAIEFGFHFTMMVAAGVLAIFFYRAGAQGAGRLEEERLSSTTASRSSSMVAQASWGPDV